MLEAEFVLDDAARGRLLSRFGEGVRAWCAGLPRLVEQYCSRWDLRLEEAQSGSTSRVYFGWQRGGALRPGQSEQSEQSEREVVLKVTPEPSIARAEAAALRAWAVTPHAVSLLDSDPGGGALLLERVRPGTKLWDAGVMPPAAEMAALLSGLRVATGDQAATGDLAGQLPPLSERIEFIFDLIRGRLAGPRVAPLVDPGLVTAGHELARALVRTGPAALVHGDLHLANILIARQPGQPGRPIEPSQPGRLVAIDPRPCLGDPDFDTVDWVLAPATSRTPEQRIEELADLVPGLDADRLWAWCQAIAIIIVVQQLHNRPADSRIPFLLQLAAR